MARFYGEIQGNRGTASRMGTPNSGMWAHIRGWNVGIYVRVFVDPETGRDVIEFHQTGGSNDSSRRGQIGRYDGA
jgi:hypothetical protein